MSVGFVRRRCTQHRRRSLTPQPFSGHRDAPAGWRKTPSWTDNDLSELSAIDLAVGCPERKPKAPDSVGNQGLGCWLVAAYDLARPILASSTYWRGGRQRKTETRARLSVDCSRVDARRLVRTSSIGRIWMAKSSGAFPAPIAADNHFGFSPRPVCLTADQIAVLGSDLRGSLDPVLLGRRDEISSGQPVFGHLLRNPRSRAMNASQAYRDWRDRIGARRRVFLRSGRRAR